MIFLFSLFVLFGGEVALYYSVDARGVRFDTFFLWFSFYASGSLWGFWFSQRPATHAEPLISTAMREHGDTPYHILLPSLVELVKRVTDTCQSTN